MEFAINSLMQWHDQADSWLERVLWVADDGEGVVCLKITDRRTWPFYRTATELNKAFADQNVRTVGHDPYLRAPVDRHQLSKDELQRWNKLWNAIEPIVEDPKRQIFGSRKDRRGLIKQAVKRSGLHKTTIYNLLWKFWRLGQAKQCVLCDYRRCGSRGKGRDVKGGKKRGRRSALEISEGTKIGIVITPSIEARLVRGLRNYYESAEKRTLHEAYKLILGDEFNDGYEFQDGKRVPILRAETEQPTFRQVQYVHQKMKDPQREATKRDGRNAFDLAGRAIIGKSETHVFGPGAVAQIDATTADIYLRSAHEPKLIVGRPIIYAMKDVWGRFLYCAIATFERPSYWGAALALENALVNKVEYCKQHGVTINKDEWPVDFLPEKLIADRGELATYKSDHLIEGLGIRIANEPPRRGDLKGIIEQHFRTINNQFIKWLPGTVPRFRKSDEKRAELDAALTVEEFRFLLIQAVLNYHRKRLNGYVLAADMIAAGVEPRPIELLRWGLENRTGRFLCFPLDQARLQLLPGGIASVRAEGIVFGGVFFTCERAEKEKWFERARQYGRSSMQIAYDPRLVDRIFLRGPNTTTLEACILTERDRRFIGWTWDEVEDWQKQQKLLRLESRHDELQEDVRLAVVNKQVGDNARARQKVRRAVKPSESKAAQLGNIQRNQAALRLAERVQSAQGTFQQKPAPSSVSSDNIIPLPVTAGGSPPSRPAETKFLKRLRNKVEEANRPV